MAPRRQAFSLPYGYTNYLFKNFSANLYKKLIQTCKVFFAANRILVFNDFTSSSCPYWQEWNYDSNSHQMSLYHKLFPLKDLKLWITDSIKTFNFKFVMQDLLSNLTKYIYKSNVKHLTILDQHLSLHELSKLTEYVEDFGAYDKNRIYYNESLATIGDVLAVLPKVVEFVLYVFKLFLTY